MRIVIMSLGTIGDVLPYTGLARRIKAAGHKVVFAVEESFRSVVEASGFELRPLRIDCRALLAETRANGGEDLRGANRLFGWRAMARQADDAMIGAFDSMVAASRDADLLLVSYTAAMQGYLLSTAMGIPSMGLYLFPATQTREFPPPLLGARTAGPIGNMLAWPLGLRAMSGLTGWPKEFQRRLDLPQSTMYQLDREMTATRWPIRYGFSPAVLPRPRDWPGHIDVVGYWWPHHQQDWQPPQALADFLADGPAPVLITLGSLGREKDAWMSELFADALRFAGMRGVLHDGSGKLHGGSDGNTITAGHVPHEWLLPRMAAIVHHGGAGTTGAGLRAGLPSVEVPIAFDADFWAKRLVGLGVSPGSLPVKKLTANRLAELIKQAVSTPSIRDRAKALAARINQEDGAGRVVAELDQLAVL